MINKTVPPGNTQINSIFRDSWYGLLIIKEKKFFHTKVIKSQHNTRWILKSNQKEKLSSEVKSKYRKQHSQNEGFVSIFSDILRLFYSVFVKCFFGFYFQLKKNIVCISVNIKDSEDMSGLNWENIQQVEEILLSLLDWTSFPQKQSV